MLKKLAAILLAFIILATFSVTAYAGQTDGVSNTTTPAINTSAQQQGSTGSAIKGTTSSKSAISNKNAITSEGAITSESAITSEGAITSESAITSKSAITSPSAMSVKKPDFEEVFNGVLKDGTAVSNEYFVMTITNPEKDKESTYYKSYVLSGNSKYDDVVISIAKYNENTGEYEPMYNTDGESSWEIGEFRLFSKEILLTEGTNKIKMLAYRTSQKEEALKDSIQVNCFTIKLLNESIAKKILKKTAELIGVDKLEMFTNKTK